MATETFWGRRGGHGVVYRLTADGSEYAIYCGRCGGEGYITFYGHVENGVCFQCGGGRGSLGSISREEGEALIRAQEKRAAEKEAKRVAAVAARDAKIAQWRAANPEAAAAYDALSGPFKESLEFGLLEHGSLTAGQTEALVKIAAQRAAEEAAPKSAVPEGREVVTGEIVSVKWVPGYGYNSPDVAKIVVRDDRGFKVYGTLPSALSAAERGSRVTFTAGLERSRDDEAFGFFKRPTKAALV